MSEYVERVPESVPFWKGNGPLLGAIDVELTERCNNDCIHCCVNLPAHDDCARAQELSTGEFKRILNEAAGLGCLQVRFTGGEPLLRTDFEELYVFARRLGMRVLLFTNARLVTPRLADLFARIPPRIEIEVSSYGMRAESYEAVSRAPGSFTQFRRGVELLLERNVPFVVKSALLPPNRGELDEFEAWAAGIPWMKEAPRQAMFFDLRRRRDQPEKSAGIASLRLRPEDSLSALNRDRAANRRASAEFCEKFARPHGERLFDCGAGRGGCVDAYGYYHPCLSLRAPEFAYDLHGGTLRDALENFFPRLEELKPSDPAYMERCANCFLKGFCEQCPAKSWIETGTLDAPVEYLCQVAHAQAVELGLLGLDERAWAVIDWRRRVEKLAEEVQNPNGKKQSLAEAEVDRTGPE